MEKLRMEGPKSATTTRTWQAKERAEANTLGGDQEVLDKPARSS